MRKWNAWIWVVVIGVLAAGAGNGWAAGPIAFPMPRGWEGLHVKEQGATEDWYRMVLTAAPAEEVVVTPVDETGDVTFEPECLVFTSENWDQEQEVTVKAVDDEVSEGEFYEMIMISHRFSGSGYEIYDDVPEVQLSVIIEENDCGGWGYFVEDINSDCYVDLYDLVILCEQWLPEEEVADCNEVWEYAAVDLNYDCRVDLLDFALLGNMWLRCTMPFDPFCGP